MPKRSGHGMKTPMVAKIDPAGLYQQLGLLLESMPDLHSDWTAPGSRAWLGRATALVEAGGDILDYAAIKHAADHLGGTLHHDNVYTIISVVHRTVARAELAAPPAMQGAFIPVGGSFTAAAAVSKVLQGATTSALIVDPYADANLLTEFAVLAPETVMLKILSDVAVQKPALQPTAKRWVAEYGNIRPLELRLAPAKSLHDRLIIVDNRTAWALGQSFNAIAARSPTTITLVNPETSKMKVEAYGAIWASAAIVTLT